MKHLLILGFLGWLTVVAEHPAMPVTPTAQLHPMVPMFHKWQMEKAPERIEQLAREGETEVQLCICAQSVLDKEFRVQNIGILTETRDGEGNTFYPFDATLHAQWRGYLEAAFAACKKNQMSLSLLIHLNAYGDIQEWRNHFQFDPLVAVEGGTYREAIILPIMVALEATLPPDHPVNFSLQGEMGFTVFAHPVSWTKLVREVKERGKLKQLKVGLSFNHSDVQSKVTVTDALSAELNDLWYHCDFIGVSMYQKVSVHPQAKDFHFNLGRFAGEFAALHCPIPDGKPIHVVEVGIGGGGKQIPSLDPADAAHTPYMGTGDPKLNPWTQPALAKLRAEYYRAFCDFLEQPLERHPVCEAYLWSFGSWDLHGVEEKAFRDEALLKMVREHNAKGGKHE